MSIPNFKYHPDPIASGSVEPSKTKCVCCHQKRGFIYVGPVYAEDELDESICPWCIHDGSAHKQFDAVFTDDASITTADGAPADLSEATLEEVAFRTPGFAGWQQEHWLVCCGEPAAFIAHAGTAELKGKFADAIDSIQGETGLSGPEWNDYLNALQKDGSPTAYVFQCLHCRRHLAYSDCD